MRANGKEARRYRGWLSISLYIILLIMGGVLLLFPLVSQYIYYEVVHEEIALFEQGATEISSAELEKRLNLAQAYNDAVDARKIADPWTQREKDGVAEYSRIIEVREQIGFIEIPKIASRLPIFGGTSEVVLEKGVGHLEGTALPIGGLNTHSVLTAHRGLPTAQMFRDLDQLTVGDVFYVTTLKGKLAYQVDQTSVVEPTDIQAVQMIEGKDYITLLTCTPFMINSHRLLVRGEQIEFVETPNDSQIAPSVKQNPWMKWLVGVSILLLLLIIYILSLLRTTSRKQSK